MLWTTFLDYEDEYLEESDQTEGSGDNDYSYSYSYQVIKQTTIRKLLQRWWKTRECLMPLQNVCHNGLRSFWSSILTCINPFHNKNFFLLKHRRSLGHRNICNIAKFRKNQAKNNKVPTFFYVKVFRWTGHRSLPIPARKVLNVQKLKSNQWM